MRGDMHVTCRPVYGDTMPYTSRRLNVTLDPAYAAKLAKMAERTHVNEGTLARSLLSQALDEADADPRHVADLLDGLPGALERANQGLKDAKAGRTVNLDDL
jgi:predicted transcriptional regulator